MSDATDPDIDTFKSKGGKILIVQGTTDMLVSHDTTTDYVERMVARYGSDLRDFVRYYVVPGFGHGFGEFNSRWDALSALDNWRDNSEAPVNPVVLDIDNDRTRPMCEYPSWPRYNGTGDEDSFENYSCTTY